MIEKKTQLSEIVFNISMLFPYWEYFFLQRIFILCTTLTFLGTTVALSLLDT